MQMLPTLAGTWTRPSTHTLKYYTLNLIVDIQINLLNIFHSLKSKCM
jgi:hypothetical protein